MNSKPPPRSQFFITIVSLNFRLISAFHITHIYVKEFAAFITLSIDNDAYASIDMDFLFEYS